jgi:peptidoglycan/LPS O-acetylase OafA/YrhL
MFINIRRWLGPPSFEGDEEKSRAAILLNIILWILIAAAFLYGLFAPIEPELIFKRTLIIVPFLLALLLFKQMVNWENVRSTGILTVFAIWLLITSAMFSGADYNNPAFMGYLVVIVCAGLILNWRAHVSRVTRQGQRKYVLLHTPRQGIEFYET